MNVIKNKNIKVLNSARQAWRYANMQYTGYLYNKNMRKQRKLILKNKNIVIPKVALLEITHKCNLRCNMCCIRGKLNKNNEGDITLEEIKKVIDSLSARNVKVLRISGGEPFCRHDLIDVINYAAKERMKIIINTNATLLDKGKIEKLKKYKNNLSFFIS